MENHQYKKIFVLLLLISALGSADESPKVALVLSGGGAKGAAHIAVLELIEEMEIPVDIIIGTSAGAYSGEAS
jgi:NTE family protein